MDDAELYDDYDENLPAFTPDASTTPSSAMHIAQPLELQHEAIGTVKRVRRRRRRTPAIEFTPEPTPEEEKQPQPSIVTQNEKKVKPLPEKPAPEPAPEKPAPEPTLAPQPPTPKPKFDPDSLQINLPLLLGLSFGAIILALILITALTILTRS